MTAADQNAIQAALRALTLQQIREYIAQGKQRMAAIKGEIEQLEDELFNRLQSDADALFQAAGKNSGDVTFERDGLKFKASIGKSVSWDGAKLQEIAASMDWPTVQRIFKIDFGMAEATFKAIPDEALRARIEEARTVKLGALTIKPV